MFSSLLSPNEVRRSYRLGHKDHLSTFNRPPSGYAAYADRKISAPQAVAPSSFATQVPSYSQLPGVPLSELSTRELCQGLEEALDEKMKLVATVDLARNETATLRNTVDRLTQELAFEKEKSRLASAETAQRIQTTLERAGECKKEQNDPELISYLFKLVNFQRALLQEKDEEIKNITALTNAFKEQCKMYRNHVAGEQALLASLQNSSDDPSATQSSIAPTPASQAQAQPQPQQPAARVRPVVPSQPTSSSQPTYPTAPAPVLLATYADPLAPVVGVDRIGRTLDRLPLPQQQQQQRPLSNEPFGRPRSFSNGPTCRIEAMLAGLAQQQHATSSSPPPLSDLRLAANPPLSGAAVSNSGRVLSSYTSSNGLRATAYLPGQSPMAEF